MPQFEKPIKEFIDKTKKLALHPLAAGRKATVKIPIANINQTIGEVRSALFEKPSDFETINYVYVVDKHKRLIGTFSIQELFKKDAETAVKDVVLKNVVKAYNHTRQEEVAYLALKYKLKAIPLVDKRGILIGVVPSDNILAILDKEAKTDFMYMAGILPGRDTASIKDEGVLGDLLWQRLPWIIFGLFGGILAAYIISRFEQVLKSDLLIASFIPLVAYLANAVGVQTQTIFIRDLVIVPKLKFAHYFTKQTSVAALIGIICGIIIWFLNVLIWKTASIGLVVGFAVFFSILIASLFALLVPFTLLKLGKDPAIGSGPFSTIVQDILSIIIYFVIASALI